MKQLWTQEPWPGTGDVIAYRHDSSGTAINDGNEAEDYQRARVCVNACAGLTDPAEFIKQARGNRLFHIKAAGKIISSGVFAPDKAAAKRLFKKEYPKWKTAKLTVTEITKSCIFNL